MTLFNDNWHFLINGCGWLLFLEVNLYCFGRELRGGCFWEVYNVPVLC